jgi:chemotaxis protein MotA
VKASSAIGLVVGFATIALGATMEGSNIMAVLNPTALLIVLGGTFGATMAGTSFAAVKNIPTLYKKAFTSEPPDLNGKVGELVGYAEKARRDGLLALDEQLSEVEDPFTRKGLQLVVDGTDPELVAEVLDAENTAMRKRHIAGAQPFEKAGGFAPTMGIVGTVFGLVHVLQNLDSPETLGPSISAAFIATLVGVGSANVIFLPIANRLKQLSSEELHARELIVEGILSVQSGDNPRVVQEKLITFVAPSQRPSADGAVTGGPGGGAERAAA